MDILKKTHLALAIMTLVLLLGKGVIGTASGTEVPPEKALREGFALRLAAVAPEGGWDSPEGKSADAGMQLVFREVNSTRKGLKGLEVVIEKTIQPRDADSARKLVDDLRAKSVLGIICFAQDFHARFVAQAASNAGMPLILCHAETLPLGKTLQTPDPFLFALDLDKSFRPLALKAKAGENPSAPWFIFVDRVDKYLSRQGESTEEALRTSGILPETFWFVSGSVQNIMGRLTECTATETPQIISWMSPLMTLRLYATARKEFLDINLIHGDTPSDLLRSHEGILVFDQAVPLRDRSLLGTLGDRLWARWGSAHYGITEEAVRGALAAEWFRLAIQRLPAAPVKWQELARYMEDVGEIHIEGLRIPISSRTHRPASRDVAVLRSTDNRWQEVGRITVHQE